MIWWLYWCSIDLFKLLTQWWFVLRPLYFITSVNIFFSNCYSLQCLFYAAYIYWQKYILGKKNKHYARLAAMKSKISKLILFVFIENQLYLQNWTLTRNGQKLISENCRENVCEDDGRFLFWNKDRTFVSISYRNFVWKKTICIFSSKNCRYSSKVFQTKLKFHAANQNYNYEYGYVCFN